MTKKFDIFSTNKIDHKKMCMKLISYFAKQKLLNQKKNKKKKN